MAFGVPYNLLDLFRLGSFAGYLLLPIDQRSPEGKVLFGIQKKQLVWHELVFSHRFRLLVFKAAMLGKKITVC